VWTIVNSNNSGSTNNFTVTVTDPATNQSVYNFGGEYQTQAKYYQGTATGTPLKTVVTCYNGNFSNCATWIPPTTLLRVTQTDVYTSLNGSSSNLVETKYDSYGNTIEVKQYDFGAAMPPSGNPVSDTVISYGQSWNSTSGSCNLYSGTYISNTPCYSHTMNSSQVDIAKTQITYNNTGHATSTMKWTSGSAWLTSSATYNSNGTVATITDVNGNTVYTYGYNGTNGCNSLLPTSITVTGTNLPSGGLATSQQWNCAGGVVTESIDSNQQPTIYAFSDPLWRITSATDPMSYVTNYTYPSNTTSEGSALFNSSASTSDVLSTVDGLGRIIYSQKRQGPAPGTTTFDSIQSQYGWNTTGPYATRSMPYSATAGQSAPNGTAVTSAQSDALGRPLTVVDGAGGTTSYTYAQNDVRQKVSGTQMFQKQFEYDGLGRLTSVCEISSTLSGVGTCAQSISQTGYWTRYMYDALGHLVSVVQNAQAAAGSQQTRAFTYDGAGRVTSESNPETGHNGTNGVVTYTYDTACATTAASPGDLTGKLDNAGNTTCYSYDGLHRARRAGYNGTCRSWNYDNSVAAPAGVTVGYTNARLIEVSTDNCGSTTLTEEWFGYDQDGHLTDIYQSSPHSGGYYHTQATYWPIGTVRSLSVFNSTPTALFPTIYYGANGAGLDGEGRVTQVTASGTGTTPVTSVSYSTSSTTNPLGALTGVTFGSADSDSFSYNPSTGRLTNYTFSVNGKTDIGTLQWNTNGTLSQLVVNDKVPNSSDSQTCNYLYDDLQRLSASNCGSLWTQTFTYDPFGNITKIGSGTFMPGYSPTQNQFTSIPGVSVQYDANGNLLTDNLNTYTWDPNWGNMLSVDTGTQTVKATYDALGRMVETSTNPNQFIYGPNGKKLAIGHDQTLVKAFVSLPGGGEAIYNSSAVLSLYRHSDWLGSSRLASTVTQPTAVYSSSAYAPFGEQYAHTGSIDVSFTGRDPDTVSSLYDFPARHQSPSQGRWISPDPAGRGAVSLANPQSWNRYAYVNNNPLALVDPMGLSVRHRGPRAMVDENPVEGDDDDDDDDSSGSGGGGCQYDACVTAPPPVDAATQDSQVTLPCIGIFGGVNDTPGDPAFGSAADETLGQTFFPLPGSGVLNGVGNVGTVAGLTGSASAQQVANWVNSMFAAGNTNLALYAFSGGGGLLQQAWPMINPAAQSAVTQVTFISPGGMTGDGDFFPSPAQTFSGHSAQTFFATGAVDNAVFLSNDVSGQQDFPGGTTTTIPGVPHNFGLEFNSPQVQATIPLSAGCVSENENLPLPGDPEKGDNDVLVAWLQDLTSIDDAKGAGKN